MRKKISELTTRDEILTRHWEVCQRHQDERAANKAKEDALLKRLQDMRKAKALANKRADAACEALKSVIDVFKGATPQ